MNNTRKINNHKNHHSATELLIQKGMKTLTSGCFFCILYWTENIPQCTLGEVVDELFGNSIKTMKCLTAARLIITCLRKKMYMQYLTNLGKTEFTDII